VRTPVPMETLIYSYGVIPAKAGIQNAFYHSHSFLGPRLRGDDAVEGTRNKPVFSYRTYPRFMVNKNAPPLSF